VNLFILSVAIQLDDLHAVTQRDWNGFQLVGSGDKEHIAQVKVHIHIMVTKSMVLGGIKHLQKCACRISVPVSTDLVNLIQHKDRVSGTGTLYGLNNTTGHGANIGAPVASNFRLITYATEAHAGKLALHGSCDALSQAGFADPWWACET